MVQDHASPFNIADNLEVPYFSDEETFTLLHMHEEETGQIFHREVLAYSFETYIQDFFQEVEGKSYLEPHSGLGRCDLLFNIGAQEYVIEFKIYQSPAKLKRVKTS